MRVLLNGKLWDKESVQALIDRDDKAVARALMVVYANQTADEQQSKDTYHRNDAGFNHRDAEFLSDIAEKWKIWGRWASPRQCNAVRRAVRKYHRQILQHMLDTNPDAMQIKGRAGPEIANAIQTPADGDYSRRAIV